MFVLNSPPTLDTVSSSPARSPSPRSSAAPGEHPEHTLQEGLPAEEVHQRAMVARAHLGRAQRALCFWLVEMEKGNLYRHFGCSSVFHYGELYLELAPHTIAEYLRSGKEMKKLPLLAKACEKGEISTSKIREISRVAVPETEMAWLEIARTSTYRQIEKLVPFTPKGGLPPMATLAKRCATGVKGEHVVVSEQVVKNGRTVKSEQSMKIIPGMQERENESSLLDTEREEPVGAARYRTKLVLDLDNDRLGVILKALEKARKETGEKDRGALLEHMALMFLESGESKPGNGVPYRVTVHHNPAGEVAWMEGSNGPLHVTQNTVDEALCDAEILDLEETGSAESSMISDRPSGHENKGISPGRDHMPGSEDDLIRRGPRLRRTIPPALRRMVLERDDRQCTAPGCGHRLHLALHHIEPVAAGGRDRASNLTTTCSRCHRALHWGRLSVEGEAPGRLRWKSRVGKVLG